MKRFLIATIGLFTIATTYGQTRGDIDPQRMTEMRARIEDAAKKIAAEYGNPPFSMIVSNEGAKAEWVRVRINALQKTDAAESSLRDIQQRLAAVTAQLAAKESSLAETNSQLKGAHLELENARKDIQAQSAPPPAPRVTMPAQMAPTQTIPAQPVVAPVGAAPVIAPAQVQTPVRAGPTPMPPPPVQTDKPAASGNGGIEEAIAKELNR